MRIGILGNGQPAVIDDRSVATSGTAILAMRGGGKSWLNAVIAEGLCNAKMPFAIIDPEGEYWTLKIGFPKVVVAGGDHADIPLSVEIAKEIAECLVKERLELILDISDMRRNHQISFLTDFLEELFTLETKERIPLWVSFEEADIWIPQIGNPACKERVLDVCQRGRKRGLGFSLVSQRPAIVDKTALSQAEYRFFKRFQQPQDLNAVKDYLGPYEKMVEMLPSLQEKQALFYAPTLLKEPVTMDVSLRKSPHGGATPEQIAMIKPTTAILNLKERLEKLLIKKREEKDLIKTLTSQIERLREEINKKEEEIERLKTAREAAKMLTPEIRKTEWTKLEDAIKERDARIAELEEQLRRLKIQTTNSAQVSVSTPNWEFLERILVYGLDMKTGRVLGDEYADLLLNQLTPDQRIVYIQLRKARQPLRIREIGQKVTFSESKIRKTSKTLQRMRLIEATRWIGKGKYYKAKV